MKRLIAFITILAATLAAPSAAFARSIVELDAKANVTARVIDGTIEPLVSDHQADHDPVTGIVIWSGDPATAAQEHSRHQSQGGEEHAAAPPPLRSAHD